MRLDLMNALCSAPPHTQFHASVFSYHSNSGLLMRQGRIRASSIGCVPAMAISSLRTEAASREVTNSRGGRDSGEVAVLDMWDYFCDEAGAREGFVVNLREQCHTVGLFYVKNHGVSLPLCEEMLGTARKFFDLPACVKNELDYNASPQFRGYMKIGVENTAGLVDFREQIEFGPEENRETNSDGNGNTAVLPVFRRLRGPNQWPPAAQIPEFRPTAMEFMDQMNVVSMHLMQALALSLGLDHDYFDSTFLSSPHFQMKVARYPPKPTEDGNAGVGVFGVGPHSDTGFLSLLLQDNVGGLQLGTSDFHEGVCFIHQMKVIFAYLARVDWSLGMALTLGASEMISKSRVTGTAEIVRGLYSSMQLGFGLGMGENLVWWAGDSTSAKCVTQELPLGWKFILFLGYAAGSNILLMARFEQWPGMTITAFAGYVVSNITKSRLTSSTSSAVSAFVVGITGNTYSYFTGALPLVMIISGINPLVPGSIGVQSIAMMLKENATSGVGFVFEMVVVALSLTIGLLIAKLAMPAALQTSRPINFRRTNLPSLMVDTEQATRESSSSNSDSEDMAL